MATDMSEFTSTWTSEEEGRGGTMTIEFRTKVAPELKGVMPEEKAERFAWLHQRRVRI